MTIESFGQDQYTLGPIVREVIDYIPEDRVFKFKYKLLKGIARRQLDSYLRRIRFQKSMEKVYIFEINKLILNKALTSIIKIIRFNKKN